MLGGMLSLSPPHRSDIAEIVAAFAGFGWGGKDRTMGRPACFASRDCSLARHCWQGDECLR
jgi:hypothetical protein